jgi:hypothetical protein
MADPSRSGRRAAPNPVGATTVPFHPESGVVCVIGFLLWERSPDLETIGIGRCLPQIASSLLPCHIANLNGITADVFVSVSLTDGLILCIICIYKNAEVRDGNSNDSSD